MKVGPVTLVQLFAGDERWTGAISSSGGVRPVEISDFAQGDLGAAIAEILQTLWQEWSINEPMNWTETTPGVWTADRGT